MHKFIKKSKEAIIAYNIYILQVIYFSFPILTFFYPRIAPILLSITTLISFKRTTLNFKILVWPALFLAWSLFSFCWSSDPQVNSFFKFLGVLSLGFIYLHNAPQEKTLKALFLGTIITALIMLIDSSLESPWSQFKNSFQERLYAKVSMILSFIAVLALHHISSRLYKIIFSSISLLALYFAKCDSALLAYLVGLLFYSLFQFKYLRTSIHFLTKPILIIALLSGPLLIDTTYNKETILAWNKNLSLDLPSYFHRLFIWKDVTNLIKEKPFIGYGFSSSKDTNSQKADFIYVDLNKKEHKVEYVATHPHNYILQLWLELGLIGVLLWICLTFQVLPYIPLTLFAATQMHLLFSIGLWQTWWWAALFLVLGVIPKTPATKTS